MPRALSISIRIIEQILLHTRLRNKIPTRTYFKLFYKRFIEQHKVKWIQYAKTTGQRQYQCQGQPSFSEKRYGRIPIGKLSHLQVTLNNG